MKRQMLEKVRNADKQWIFVRILHAYFVFLLITLILRITMYIPHNIEATNMPRYIAYQRK